MSVTLSAHGKIVVRRAVANAIRVLRRGGETAQALAARFGVTHDSIERWCGGLGYPALTQAQRIAPLVGLDPMTGRPKS